MKTRFTNLHARTALGLLLKILPHNWAPLRVCQLWHAKWLNSMRFFQHDFSVQYRKCNCFIENKDIQRWSGQSYINRLCNDFFDFVDQSDIREHCKKRKKICFPVARRLGATNETRTTYPSGAPEFIPGNSGVRVTRSLVFYVYVMHRLVFAIFLLAIVLSVLLRFADADYSLGIFKFFSLPEYLSSPRFLILFFMRFVLLNFFSV